MVKDAAVLDCECARAEHSFETVRERAAVRHLPASYSPGLRMTVTLDVNPPAGVSFYKIEETVTLPTSEEGWAASNVSHGGVVSLRGDNSQNCVVCGGAHRAGKLAARRGVRTYSSITLRT